MTEPATEAGLLSGDTLTWAVTLLALVIVLIPFFRGMRISFQAWTATRCLKKSDLARALGSKRSDDVEPLSVLMLRVLKKTLSRREHPADFVFDATRQYVMNEFELFYSRPITMFASLLPPIGFIGTTVGMLILFVSMHKSDSTLELSALAVALTSSIFALIAFAILEGVKIRLYTRMLLAMREVEALYGDADAKSQGEGTGLQAQGVPA
jgi:hypothetical protein